MKGYGVEVAEELAEDVAFLALVELDTIGVSDP